MTRAAVVPDDGGFGHRVVTVRGNQYCIWCDGIIPKGNQAVTWSWTHYRRYSYEPGEDRRVRSASRNYMHTDCWHKHGFVLPHLEAPCEPS